MRVPLERKSLVVILSSRDDINPIISSLSMLALSLESGEINPGQVHLLIVTDRRPRKELVTAVRKTGVPVSFAHLSRLRLVIHRVIWLFAYRFRAPLFPRMLSRRRSLLSTYLPKVRMALDYADKGGFDLVVKCDDDAILSRIAWRVLVVDSRRRLSDPRCVLVTPALSSGIPTWVDYAELMMSQEERSLLLQRLREVDLPSTCWGVDYTDVLDSQHGESWDEGKYLAAIGALEHPYKGFHPIRFDASTCAGLVSVGLKNLDKFLERTTDRDVTYRTCRDYLCNVVFATTPEMYRRAIGNDVRLIDPFDEVPINSLVREDGHYYLVATKAPAIHLLYNSAYGQSVRFEGIQAESRELEIQMASSISLAIQNQG